MRISLDNTPKRWLRSAFATCAVIVTVVLTLAVATPPALAYTGAGEKWEIRAFNVDDVAYVDVNGTFVDLNGTAAGNGLGFRGDSGWRNITALVNSKGANSGIRLRTYNRGSGYTWGFQIARSSFGGARTILYSAVAGTAGVTGANGNDQTRTYRWVLDRSVRVGDLVPAELSVYAVRMGPSSGAGLGHGWITLKNDSSKSIQVLGVWIRPGYTLSVGTWGNKGRDTAWYNLEQSAASSYVARRSRTQSLSSAQFNAVTNWINGHKYWYTWYNCSSFASGAWNSVARYKMSLITTPTDLYNALYSTQGGYVANRSMGVWSGGPGYFR